MFVLVASPVGATDHPHEARLLRLKQDSGSGVASLAWIVHLPLPLLPAASPLNIGASLRVIGIDEDVTIPLPANNWFTSGGTGYRFLNRLAPRGPSPVRSASIRALSAIKVRAKTTGIQLDDERQGTVSIILAIGKDRYCSVCNRPILDAAGRYVARSCGVPPACPPAVTTTTSTTTSPSTTSVPSTAPTSTSTSTPTTTTTSTSSAGATTTSTVSEESTTSSTSPDTTTTSTSLEDTTTTTSSADATTTTTTLPCGTSLLAWGGPGTDAGQFDGAGGIALGPSGGTPVYVVDSGNHRIQRFTSDGAFELAWGGFGSGPGEFDSPSDVAVDGSGNVYVADTLNHRIQKFDAAGSFLLAWGGQGSADGAFLAPEGIIVDAGGNVLVADTGNDRIQMFLADGTFVTKWGTHGSADGELDGPRDVEPWDGGYAVADTGNQRVQVFQLAGVPPDAEFVRKWAVAGSPVSIAGSFLADQANDLVLRLDSDGNVLDSWTTAGGPRGVAAAAGVVYVSNATTNTIQKFSCQ